MKCPQCGKRLSKIVLTSGTRWGHPYTLATMLSTRPICAYNIPWKKED